MTPRANLAIELTYECNQRCAYCYNPERERGARPGSRHGDTEQLVARLRKLLPVFRPQWVTLTGGEPLAHPGLFSVLEELRHHGTTRQLITNGTLITDEMAERLSAEDLTAVQITLNGPTAEAHKSHVGRDSFHDACAGIERLLARQITVVGCIVVTRQNAALVGETIRLLKSFGVRTIALSRFSPAGSSLPSHLAWLPRRSDLMTAFAHALPFAQAGLRVRCTVPVPRCLMDVGAYAPIEFGGCAIGTPSEEFALGPDGCLRLCTLHASRLGGGRDVLCPDYDLESVLTAPEVVGYRQNMPDFCAGCAMSAACLGGCSACGDYRVGTARVLDPLVARYFGE